MYVPVISNSGIPGIEWPSPNPQIIRAPVAGRVKRRLPSSNRPLPVPPTRSKPVCLGRRGEPGAR